MGQQQQPQPQQGGLIDPQPRQRPSVQRGFFARNGNKNGNGNKDDDEVKMADSENDDASEGLESKEMTLAMEDDDNEEEISDDDENNNNNHNMIVATSWKVG